MMSLKETYQNIVEQHQTAHSYRTQAEKIAVEAFLSFDDDSKASFFDFLKQIYPEKSQIYRFFFTQYANLRVGKQVLSRHHKRYLLAVILPFLPTESKFYLLLCETLDSLQAKKIQSRYQINLEELRHLLHTQHHFITALDSKPSVWFHAQSYQEQDRMEILTVVKYLQLKKLGGHAKHLEQDLALITAHLTNLPPVFEYFVYYWGIEVAISKNKMLKKPISISFENALPTPAGIFADVLKSYMIDELAIIEKEAKQQAMQQDIFEHDLQVSLTHHKNSLLPTNRIESEMILQASAGVFKIKIKRKKIIEKTIYATGAGAGLLAFLFSPLKGGILLGITCTIWLFSILAKMVKAIYSKRIFQHHKKTAIIKIQMDKYRDLIEERKEELNYIYVRDNLLDKIKDAFYWRIKQKKIGIYADNVYYDPLDILNLYKKYADYIQNIQLQDIDILYAFSTSKEDKQECLKIMKHLFMRKLMKSYKSFINLADYMIDYTLKFRYYMFFIDKECAIVKDFANFYTDLNGNGLEAQKVTAYKKMNTRLTDLFLNLEIHKEGKPIYNQALSEWFDFEIQEISQQNLAQERQKLETFIAPNINQYFNIYQEDSQHDVTKIYQNVLILEGQEGILFFTK